MDALLKFRAVFCVIVYTGASYNTKLNAAVPERPAGCKSRSGLPATYSKCTQSPAPKNGMSADPYCLDNLEKIGNTLQNPFLSAAGDSGDGKFLVQKKSLGTNNELVVVDIPVKNCRKKTNKMQGNFAIVVDSSESVCSLQTNSGTDCAKKRLDFAQTLLHNLYSNATSGKVEVGVLAYGGRYGDLLDTWTGLNQDLKKLACENSDKGSKKVDPWAGAIRPEDPWRVENNGSYASFCELLTKQDSSKEDNLKSFIEFTGALPRGSTDLTYFFQGAQTILENAATDTTPHAKHAIVITDGLPNIPIKRPKSECDTRYILTQANYPTINGSEYCLDRNFRYAARVANDYAEGISAFSPQLADTFPSSTINVYHTLYVSNGLAFYDYDADSTYRASPSDPLPTPIKLDPYEFLAENSARTGNGRQKVKYLRGDNLPVKESLYWNELAEVFDSAAVHHVEVKIGNKSPYNAVSHGRFANETASDAFRIRLIGLENGANTVTITVYYNDSEATPTSINLIVTVQDNPVAGQTYCEDASTSLTVDGYDPNTETPTGDGVLPFPNSNNTKPPQCRAFRNADPENGTTDFSTGLLTVENKNLRRDVAGTLRIQGGTGNCGSVVGTGGTTVYWIMLMIPLLGSLALWRKKS